VGALVTLDLADDSPVLSLVDVTAMDFSAVALSRYVSTNGDRARCLLGDVRHIPVRAGSFDGVYNLGVMEHFTAGELEKIFQEFYRVLKPGGRIVLFWPPRYGVSVIGLKVIHNLLKYGLRYHARLHPDEPNLLPSQKAAADLLASHGFEGAQITFTGRDLWTYCVIAGLKRAA